MTAQVGTVEQPDKTTTVFHQSEAVSFSLQTEGIDFAPSFLAIPRTVRAWERKPQSPFSRAKVRFGKVWKRAQPIGISTHQKTGTTRRFDGLKRSDGSSPAKVVKKLRADVGTVQIREWDSRGSPSTARRIITRAGARAGGEVINGLSETDDEDALDNESIAGSHGIPDDIVEEQGSGLSVPGTTRFDTISQNHSHDPQDSAVQVEQDTILENKPLHINSLEEPSNAPAPPSNSRTSQRTSSMKLQAAPVASAERVGLPAGFVSPLKTDRRHRVRGSAQADTRRRQTLPTNFTTTFEPRIDLATPTVADPPESSDIRPDQEHSSPVTGPTIQSIIETTQIDHRPAESDAVLECSDNEQDDEWEDVSDEELDIEDASDRRLDTQLQAISKPVHVAFLGDGIQEPDKELSVMSEVEDVLHEDSSAQAVQSTASNVLRYVTLPKSTDQLRRTSRRQSASPVKRKSASGSRNEAHLVAHSPLEPRRTRRNCAVLESETVQKKIPEEDVTAAQQSTKEEQAQDKVASPKPQITSAPKSTQSQSPSKPRQPRISDDTALLQAFLKRADENKHARRESLALTSVARGEHTPSKADVLADLDPNSPLPRKQPALPSVLDGKVDIPPHFQDLVIQLPPQGKPSRRSQRIRPGNSTSTEHIFSPIPVNISIRPSNDAPALKKTEAQELAALTRTHTRRNKSGAVPPKVRLVKLAAEPLPPSTESEMGECDQAQQVNQLRRSVRWAEQLSSFHPGALLDDSISDAAASPDHDHGPSADETLTLQLPDCIFTIDTQAKITPPDQNIDQRHHDEEAQMKRKSTKRRSRLATPAKPRKTDTSSSNALADANDTIDLAAVMNAKQKRHATRLPTPVTPSQQRAKVGDLDVDVPVDCYTKPSRAQDSNKDPVRQVEHPKLDADLTVQLPSLGAATLASPAKRARRVSTAIGAPRAIAASQLPNASRDSRAMLPGLSSPAKKRTRRL